MIKQTPTNLYIRNNHQSGVPALSQNMEIRVCQMNSFTIYSQRNVQIIAIRAWEEPGHVKFLCKPIFFFPTWSSMELDHPILENLHFFTNQDFAKEHQKFLKEAQNFWIGKSRTVGAKNWYIYVPNSWAD